MIKKSFCEASHSHSHSPTPTHSHSHLILDPGSAYYADAGGGFAPSSVIGVGRSRIQDQVAVAVGGGGAVAVDVAGLTKRFFNHVQKDFLINVWGYPVLTPMSEHSGPYFFVLFLFRRPHVARPHLELSKAFGNQRIASSSNSHKCSQAELEINTTLI